MDLIDLSDKQVRALALVSEHRLSIYDGSIRSGKTIAALFAWLDFLINEKPTGMLVLTGYSTQTIQANMLGPLQELLGKQAVRYNANKAWVLGYEHDIIGAGNAGRESALRGRTLAGALVDEATLVHETFWTQLLGRLSAQGARLIATTNPDSPGHWLLGGYLNKARTVVERDGSITNHVAEQRDEVVNGDPVTIYLNPDGEELLDLARLIFTIDDNAALPGAYVQAIKAENAPGSVFYLRNIEGRWVIAAGAIYGMADHRLLLEDGTPGPHVIADTDIPRQQGIPVMSRWVIGVDAGFRNATHAILFGITREGRVYACREWRHDGRTSQREMTAADYSTALGTWADQGYPVNEKGDKPLFPPLMMPLSTVPIFLDPSATWLSTQLKRDGHGKGWTEYPTTDNSVVDGIQDVASLLSARMPDGRSAYLTSEACTHLLRERMSYTWDPKAAEAGEDKPIKVDDHGMDAERYAIRMTRRFWQHALANRT